MTEKRNFKQELDELLSSIDLSLKMAKNRAEAMDDARRDFVKDYDSYLRDNSYFLELDDAIFALASECERVSVSIAEIRKVFLS